MRHTWKSWGKKKKADKRKTQEQEVKYIKKKTKWDKTIKIKQEALKQQTLFTIVAVIFLTNEKFLVANVWKNDMFFLLILRSWSFFFNACCWEDKILGGRGPVTPIESDLT